VQELKLPELGEGVTSAEVASVLVSVGDVIEQDQAVIEVETEKASLEVPSSVAGKVTEVLVGAGDSVAVGQTILKVEGKPEAAEGADDRPAETKRENEAKSQVADEGRPPARAAAREEQDDEGETAPEADEPARPRRERRTAARAERDEADTEAETEDTSHDVIDFPRKDEPRRALGVTVPAAPSVRALARELGVDVAQVQGSGPGGRLTRDDVKAHAKAIVQRAKRAPGGAAAPLDLPDFGRWGEIERKPMSAVRRKTAEAMATAWSQIPHVTQFDRSDITQLEAMRRKFNKRPEVDERKLTVTAIVMKIAAMALRQYPEFNASLDLASDSIVYKKYVHVGCAVDTERGLLVPVVRDVNRKSLLEISVELADLAERARTRKIQPDELRGGTFTVTNLGALGTTYFSPIVNWPEVAILGVGRAETQAVYADGVLAPRTILPLSVSYDHRLIDGAGAARFLRWIAEALEQPLLLLLDEG
jgi:pyruvate dehydrogenase E2 component (dihydrolipoamide acetyltransferase)